MKHFLLTFVMSLGAISAQAQQTVENYAIDHNMPVFYQQLKAQLTYPLSYEHCAKDSGWTFNRWRTEARKAVEKTMQIVPPAPKDFSYEVLEEEQHDGYKTQLIAFNVNAWERTKAYLLIPTEAKENKSKKGKKNKNIIPTTYPAILLLHDHGAHFTIGKEKMVMPLSSDTIAMKDAVDWSGKCYDNVFVGDEFAKQGYVVLATDALLWGDRRVLGTKELGVKETVEVYDSIKHKNVKVTRQNLYNTQEALSANLLQMGTSLGAWITWDDIRSAAFLSHLPMVDSNRVGCMGHSMGAYRSWMLAALSDDIRASASVCWMNDTEHLMTLTNNQNRGGSAYTMLVPGLRNLMDYADVASLACPKPALFFNGLRDKLFPVDGVKNAYKTLKAVYSSQDVSQNLTTELWDEKHYFNKEMQQKVQEFFKNSLTPKP